MKKKLIAILVIFSLFVQVNNSFAHVPTGKEDTFNLNKGVDISIFERKANVEADSIIYGKIITLDLDREVVEAMVVKDGIIKYLGTKKVAKTMQGKNTKIYDYGESVIYPGFMDPHTHGVMAGQRLFMQCDLTGQKIILDGVIEAHTGALIDEYSDQKGYYGVLNIDNQELLNNIVKEVNGAGFSVHTHAIGDKASKMILDAYEKTSEEICDFDLRNVMCHLQLIRKEDIQRAADYNIIALVAPTWAVVEHPTFDDSLKYLGEERAWQQYPNMTKIL